MLWYPGNTLGRAPISHAACTLFCPRSGFTTAAGYAKVPQQHLQIGQCRCVHHPCNVLGNSHRQSQRQAAESQAVQPPAPGQRRGVRVDWATRSGGYSARDSRTGSKFSHRSRMNASSSQLCLRIRCIRPQSRGYRSPGRCRRWRVAKSSANGSRRGSATISFGRAGGQPAAASIQRRGAVRSCWSR